MTAPPTWTVPDLTPQSDGTLTVGWPGRDAAPTPDWALLAAGDWAAVRMFEDAGSRRPEDLYGDLLPVIRDADLRIVNLECVLGGTSPVPKDGPNLGGPPEAARALADAGFHVACLANNHTVDFGPEGLRATITACQQAGLRTVGAGENLEEASRPLVLDQPDAVIVNLAEGEEGNATWTRPGVAPIHQPWALDRVREARATGQPVIAVVHGGREYVPVPPPHWVQVAGALADAGADLVVAHHPHVPQGLSVRITPDGRSVPVLYSIGNFVFRAAPPIPWQVPPGRTAEGFLVRARFAGRSVVGLELAPYRIDESVGPRRMPPEDAARFGHLLAEISEPLADPADVEAWFDVTADAFWEHHVRNRVEGLTAKTCAGDLKAMRHAWSHHGSPAHTTLIARALERLTSGTSGQGDPEIHRKLAGWFEGTWPEAGGASDR